MSLSQKIETFTGQKLTPKDVEMIASYQSEFGIDDDDPLCLVLAIMLRSQMVLDSAPTLLEKKVNETIELHRGNLREQALLCAKQLVSDLAPVVSASAAHADGSTKWKHRLQGLAAGVGITLLTAFVVGAIKYYFM